LDCGTLDSDDDSITMGKSNVKVVVIMLFAIPTKESNTFLSVRIVSEISFSSLYCKGEINSG